MNETGAFEAAAARERELNERQWQVLRLIGRGHTNGEIAEELGMTFVAVKWNVSEILTKLGFASREEAAQYLEWRGALRRRVSRGVRALWGPMALKVGTGLAALGIAGSALFAWQMSREAPAAAVVPGSFYMEATYLMRSEGAMFRLESSEAASRGRMRQWYRDDMHYRTEVEDNAPSLSAGGATVVVADGATQWVWNPARLAFQELPASPPAAEVLPLAPGPTRVRSVDDYVARLRQQSSAYPDSFARTAGTETVLGVECVIVEYGPTWRNGEKGTAGGVGRIWVDPDRMVALRLSVEGNDGTEAVRVDVTTLRFDLPIDDEVFRWSLPSPGRPRSD